MELYTYDKSYDSSVVKGTVIVRQNLDDNVTNLKSVDIEITKMYINDWLSYCINLDGIPNRWVTANILQAVLNDTSTKYYCLSTSLNYFVSKKSLKRLLNM